MLSMLLHLKRLIAHCLAITFILCSVAHSDVIESSTSVDVVLSENTDSYNQVYDGIDEVIKSSGSNISLHKHYSNEYFNGHQVSTADLIVAVGTYATKYSFALQIETPILSVFIPKKNFLSLKNSYSSSGNGNILAAAIVIEQPMERYSWLVKNMFDTKNLKLGMFVAADSSVATDVRRQLLSTGITPVFEFIDGDININNIKNIIDNSDVIILSPEHLYIPPSKSKWILYMGYREKIPIISYSEPFYRSGASAVLFTDPVAIGKQAADHIIMMKKNIVSPNDYVAALPSVIYPDNFVYMINNKVLNTIGWDEVDLNKIPTFNMDSAK